ncbi:MAG: VOC family protein [Candidatus Dadabacteria bacterium]|nr:VOC family protein [Candidatus Dadabacteria bacterium]
MKALLNLFGSGTMIKGIDHVAIVVSDMDRSIEYYSGVLGLKILHDGRGEGGDKKSFLGTESRTLIALTEDEDRAKKSPGYVEGVHHVAFSVDDVERTRKILEDKGVEFIQEKLDKDKKKAYHFLDPDGLELEIYGESGEAVPPY